MKHVKLYENFDRLNEEVYIVMNRTDGFSASPEVMTSDEADRFIEDFPKRYKAQGYYLTSNRERIDPMDVRLEKVAVDGDEPEFGTKYEAMENITMRGLIGNFKLKAGDVITIEEGKMPKNYKVKMPTGITEINQSNIQDLIALGRLQPLDEEIEEGESRDITDVKVGDTVILKASKKKATVKQLLNRPVTKIAVETEDGQNRVVNLNAFTFGEANEAYDHDFPPANVLELTDEQAAEIERLKTEYVEKYGEPHVLTYNTDNIGEITEISYKITPEFEKFLKDLRVNQDKYLAYNTEDGRDSYLIKFKAKFPGKGKETYGHIQYVKLPK